jgi:hypothetical protein
MDLNWKNTSANQEGKRGGGKQEKGGRRNMYRKQENKKDKIRKENIP